MDTKHLVDPQLLPVLTYFPSMPPSRDALPGFRVEAEKMLQGMLASVPSSDGVIKSEEYVPGPLDAPAVRVVIYRPQHQIDPAPAVLHIHGGGYIIGQPEINEERNRLLAQTLGCVVVSVDYRLAPETPHPGPVEDCYAALKWLHTNAKTLQIDTTRIALTGESAGGGLTAALALLARDRGEIPIKYQSLSAPMLDDRTTVKEDTHPFVGEFLWTRDANRFGWECLLGKEPGSADVSPYAAAARAEDLSGLPATFITVGALDLFLEENIEYARRLTRAGVAVELHVYPGAFHGYEIAAQSDVAQKSYRDFIEGMRAALARAG